MTKLTNDIQTTMPFISVLEYGKDEYVGIVINQDQNVISFYDLEMIKTQGERELILELGEVWYWESNRQIPINIFLRNEIKDFQYAIKTFNSKDVKIIFGPSVSISNLLVKRVRRKTVQFVKSGK